MIFPTPPENILTTKMPGGYHVSTILNSRGFYETAIFDESETVYDDKITNHSLASAVRSHAECIALAFFHLDEVGSQG